MAHSNLPVVLIIGNGFDLSMKLPTSYKDFLHSKEFEGINGDVGTLHKYIKGNRNKDPNNWADIELLLSSYSNYNTRENFKKEYVELKSVLGNYLKRIETEHLSDELIGNSATLLESILYSSSKIRILNFNYTSFADKILKRRGATLPIEYIHGNLDGNIIFGVDDKSKIKPHDVFLRKSYSLNFFARDISDTLLHTDIIHFFGHSLGETDHFYFRRFFTNTISKNPTKVYFHYYGEEGYDLLHKQLDALTLNNISSFKRLNEVKFIDNSLPNEEYSKLIQNI